MTRYRKTWFVIADGMHARVLKRESMHGALEPALDHELIEPAAHGFSRDLGDDKPGRAFDTGAGGRHAMEPRSDPHELAKRGFARRVAQLVNDAAARDAFERLVLVAPPRTLGEIRAEIAPPAAERIVAESAKELMKLPRAKLEAQLLDLVGEEPPARGASGS